MVADTRLSTPTPESILIAHRRIERCIPWTPVTESANLNRQANTQRQNSTSSVDSSSPDEWIAPKIRIFIKWENRLESRGAVNLLEHLIEERGLETLQLRGIAIPEDDKQNETITLAATNYGVPVIHAPAQTPNTPHHDPTNSINGYTAENATNTLDPKGPIPITSKNNKDIFVGLGTPALELVQQVDMELKKEGASLSNSHRYHLNAVISPAEDGDTLSGICAALAETGIYVFGADSLTNSERAAHKWYSAQGEETRLDPPAGSLAWSIFTSGKCLLGVFNANDGEVRAAQRFMREQENVILSVTEAAPLAVLLFHDEFKRLITTHSNKAGGWNVGVILNRRTSEVVV